MVRLDAAPAGSRTALKAEAAKADIAMLETMTHDSLKEHWQKVFNVSIPHNLSRRLLIHALAYELQIRTYSGLKKEVRQTLQDAINAVSAKSASSVSLQNNPDHRTPPRSITISPGTRLMREWGGVVHVVDRTENEFMWNGKVYRSLSAIARAITGVRWNGLAFFGFRKRNEGRTNKASNTSSDAFTNDASQAYDLGRQANLNNYTHDDAQPAPTAPLITSLCPPSTTDPVL